MDIALINNPSTVPSIPSKAPSTCIRIFLKTHLFLSVFGFPSTRRRRFQSPKTKLFETLSRVDLFENAVFLFSCGRRLHYISPSNLRSLLLLLSLQLRDLCPYASIQGLIRPSPPRSRRDQSDRYFLNMVNPRAYL